MNNFLEFLNELAYEEPNPPIKEPVTSKPVPTPKKKTRRVTWSWDITPRGSGFARVARESAANLNLSITIEKTGTWSFWVEVSGDERDAHSFDMWLSECV